MNLIMLFNFICLSVLLSTFQINLCFLAESNLPAYECGNALLVRPGGRSIIPLYWGVAAAFPHAVAGISLHLYSGLAISSLPCTKQAAL